MGDGASSPASGTLGAAVRERRSELRLSQQEFAERVGGNMTQSDVSQLERGRVKLPRKGRLDAIASALGLSSGELLARSGWTDAGAYIRAAESPDDADDTARVVRLMGGMTDAQRRSVYNFTRYIARTKTRPRKARPTVLRESA